MSYDYLDYDLSDNEWENSDSGDFDDSLSSGSEDSEDFSSRLASFGLEDIDDLVRLQVLPVITYWVEKTNPRTQQVYQDLIEEEPHEQLLIEIKNKIRDTIVQEKDVYISKKYYKYDMERSYGTRRPGKNEIINNLEKLLDFIERLAKQRDGQCPSVALTLSVYFQTLDRDVISLLRDPWIERGETVQKHLALNVENTALKNVLKFYKLVYNNVKEHFGPDTWPAKKRIISSLSKTSSSSSVNASEVLPSESPSVGSSNGVFTALNQKTVSSANRSPQISRTSFDSPQITNASTVGERASSQEERPNRGSPVNSPRAHNTHIISSSGVKPNPSASSDE